MSDENGDPERPERRRRGHLEWHQDPPDAAELSEDAYHERVQALRAERAKLRAQTAKEQP